MQYGFFGIALLGCLAVCCGTSNVVATEVEEKPMKARDSKKVLEASLEVVGSSCSSNRCILDFTVTNYTDAPVELCKFQTPLEGQITSRTMFEIRDENGGLAKYQGIAMKRQPPSRERGDYFSLPTGKSVKGRVDIAESYILTPGKYKVRFIGSQSWSPMPSSSELEISVD